MLRFSHGELRKGQAGPCLKLGVCIANKTQNWFLILVFCSTILLLLLLIIIIIIIIIIKVLSSTPSATAAQSTSQTLHLYITNTT